MKVIIAGSRDIVEMRCLLKVLAATEFVITTVLTGGARGVDTLAQCYAQRFAIPYEEYRADWEAHGKAAGPIRNRTMARAGDALIAVWDGRSRGTRNMIDTMKALGKPVEVYLMPNCTRIAA